MMKKSITFFKLIYPILMFIAACILYAVIYCLVNYADIHSLIFPFLQYIRLFLLIITLYRIISFGAYKITKNYSINEYFSFLEIAIILFLFLFLSSLLINPMSFLFIIAPIQTNILLHLFLISTILIFIEKKVSKTRKRV